MKLCNKDCYTKGRGCVVSKDGRCSLMFTKDGEIPTYTIKVWQRELVKQKIKDVKFARQKKQI